MSADNSRTTNDATTHQIVTFRTTEEMIEDLDQLSDRRGVSRSELIRDGIEMMLTLDGGQQ